jgi:tetratricopeptide (TPR) repeat protein
VLRATLSPTSRLCLACALFTAGAKADEAPSEAATCKAIEELGSRRFAIRERAEAFLRQTGDAAEPALEDAARSADVEIATRAKAMLDDLRWGIYPDTAEEAVALARQCRKANPNDLWKVFPKLLRLNPVPVPTVRRILNREEFRGERGGMCAWCSDAAWFVLAAGDWNGAEGLLELAITRRLPGRRNKDYVTDRSYLLNDAENFAAFLALRGKLDAAVSRYARQRAAEGTAPSPADELLPWLYRIKGDRAGAVTAARRLGDSHFLRAMQWYMSDWEGLSQPDSRRDDRDEPLITDGPPAAPRSSPEYDLGNWGLSGLAAAYARLADSEQGYRERIADIRQLAEKPGLFQDAVKCMLINGEVTEAFRLLEKSGREPAFHFALLGAQFRYKEAFAVLDDARRHAAKRDELFECDLLRAKALNLLGERQPAVALLGRLSSALADAPDAELSRQLIRYEAAAGLRGPALDDAARRLEVMRKRNDQIGRESVLAPLFREPEGAVRWWTLMRETIPDESPEAALRRVDELLDGKLDRQEVRSWAEKLAADVPPGEPDVTGRSSWKATPEEVLTTLVTAARAFRATGDVRRAEDLYRQTAKKLPGTAGVIAYGDFLTAQGRHEEAAGQYAQAVARALERFRPGDFTGRGQNLRAHPALALYLQGFALTRGGKPEEGKRLLRIAHVLPLAGGHVRAMLIDELGQRGFAEATRVEEEALLALCREGPWEVGDLLAERVGRAASAKEFRKAERRILWMLRNGWLSYTDKSDYLRAPQEVRMWRCLALLREGKPDDAVREARAALDAIPGFSDLALRVVPELERIERKQQADELYAKVRGSYEKLLKDYPKSAFGHNAAAWLMAACRRDLDDALTHARKAAELESANAGYLDTLAEVHFRRGERHQALAVMKRCLELDGENAYFRRQLERFQKEPFDSPPPQ